MVSDGEKCCLKSGLNVTKVAIGSYAGQNQLVTVFVTENDLRQWFALRYQGFRHRIAQIL